MRPSFVSPRGTAAALLIVTAACQDSPTEPTQSEALAPSFAAAANSWLTRANMPGDLRLNVVAAAVGNAQQQTVLYVFGGRRLRSDGGLGIQLRNVQAYNAATNNWSDRRPSPLPIEYSHGAHALNGKIYIAGGKNGFTETLPYLWEYDPAADSWIRRQDLPVEGFGGVSGVINGKLYVLARCQGSTSPCSNPDYELPNESRFFGAWDPATDQWTPLALPPGGRDHQFGAAGVLGGKLYLAGGRSTNALDIYDPATNQWTTGPSMGSNRGFAAAATVAGKLYVIAGNRFDVAGNPTRVVTTSRFDPATNSWKNLAQSPRGGPGLGADRVVVNGQPRVALVGGARPGNNLQYVP